MVYGMIEEDQIALLHLVAHEVARLIVAHAIPCHGLFGQGSKVVNADIAWFGFHQPVAHT